MVQNLRHLGDDAVGRMQGRRHVVSVGRSVGGCTIVNASLNRCDQSTANVAAPAAALP